MERNKHKEFAKNKLKSLRFYQEMKKKNKTHEEKYARSGSFVPRKNWFNTPKRLTLKDQSDSEQKTIKLNTKERFSPNRGYLCDNSEDEEAPELKIIKGIINNYNATYSSGDEFPDSENISMKNYYFPSKISEFRKNTKSKSIKFPENFSYFNNSNYDEELFNSSQRNNSYFNRSLASSRLDSERRNFIPNPKYSKDNFSPKDNKL